MGTYIVIGASLLYGYVHSYICDGGLVNMSGSFWCSWLALSFLCAKLNV